MGNKVIRIKKDWVQKLVKNLESQITQALLELDNEAHGTFLLDPYSLGYVFGICSGGFEFHRIDRDLDKVRILIQVYPQLFGEAGHEILQTTLTLNNDEHSQFKEGTASGREESLRWFHRQENPIGLLRYVLNGEKTKSLNSQAAPYRYWARSSFSHAG